MITPDNKSGLDLIASDLGMALRRSLNQCDRDDACEAIDVAGNKAAAMQLRSRGVAAELLDTASKHLAAARRLIREATR